MNVRALPQVSSRSGMAPMPKFDLADKRVWVAGHRGMVGSAIMRRFADLGCRLQTVERASLDLRRSAEVAAWVEDHRPEGGLGEAVLEALAGQGLTGIAIAHLAVTNMPGSGTTEELLDEAGISADHIAAAARRLIDGGQPA